jgi:hypothetical protein
LDGDYWHAGEVIAQNKTGDLMAAGFEVRTIGRVL